MTLNPTTKPEPPKALARDSPCLATTMEAVKKTILVVMTCQSATANSSRNYTNAPGNVVGEILNVSGCATITNANPWPNFCF
jgi:hypothetical protein